MKSCTFCSRELQDEAITCRHCDELLAPVDPTRYDVVLLYPGCRGFDVIVLVSGLNGRSATSSRKEVLACRSGPQIIFESLEFEYAERAWASLKRVGATVEIVESAHVDEPFGLEPLR